MNWVIKLTLFMCIFFRKPLKDFPLYSHILTIWLRYLQTHIKASCILFFKTLHKTLKFQQKLLLVQAKKIYIGNHDRMEVFSTDIHWKKIMFINNVQVVLQQSERVSEMHFLAIWKHKFQKIFLWCHTLGIPHGDSELRKL